jgi:hypothetical protein
MNTALRVTTKSCDGPKALQIAISSLEVLHEHLHAKTGSLCDERERHRRNENGGLLDDRVKGFQRHERSHKVNG